MINGNLYTLMGVIIYLLAVILMGLYYIRKSSISPEDFYLARRSFGPWKASISSGTADMSGWLFLSLPGLAYFTGLGEAFWTAVGLFTGALINWLVVARRLRSYSAVTNKAISLPEFFNRRFHDKNNYLLTISAIISLLFFSLYTGIQFIIFGRIFSYIFDANRISMIIIGASIVLFYTLFGGFRATGTINLSQGFLMAFSMAVLMLSGYFHSGGFGEIIQNLKNFPRFTEFFGIAVPETAGGVQRILSGSPVFEEGNRNSITNIISTMAWGLGYFGMPQVLIRFMAIKSKNMLRPSAAIAIGWYLLVLFAALSIGLIGRALFPTALNSATTSENIFIYMSMNLFPPLISGILISGILAASMSSADSYLLIVSSSFANDIFKGAMKKDATGKQVIWAGRITMLLATIFGIIAAITSSLTIFQIVSYAWAGLGASFGPLILFSLFWKRTNLCGAVAGMVSGGIMVVVWKNILSRLGGIFAVYELLPAFIISCLFIILISLLTKKPSAEMEMEFLTAKNKAEAGTNEE